MICGADDMVNFLIVGRSIGGEVLDFMWVN